MRLLEIDLDIEALIAGLRGDYLVDRIGRVDPFEPESLRVLRDVLASEQMGRETGGGEESRCVRHRQLPIEAAVRESHHAVVMGVEAGGQAGPAWTALRRGGESHIEPDARTGESVQARAHDAVDAVAVQMATDIVRGHHDHVERPRRYGFSL